MWVVRCGTHSHISISMVVVVVQVVAVEEEVAEGAYVEGVIERMLT